MYSLPHRHSLALCTFSFVLAFATPFLRAASDPNAADIPANDAAAAAAQRIGRLECQPCTMDFGKVKIGQSKAIPVVLVNKGNAPVTISSKEKHAAWVSPLGLDLPYKILPGGRVKFHLVYEPHDTRKVIGRIAYHSNASNKLLPITVHAETSSAGTLAANPTKLDFGSVPVGNTVSKTQTITNVGNANVTLDQVTESGSGFTVGTVTTPQTLAPGHSVTFTVKFTPQNSGTNSGSLVTLSSATNYRLSVVESGTGTTAGSVSVSPSSLAFGSVAVGSSKTKTMTLTANGNAMTIKSDSLSSSEYAIGGLSLPYNLGAGKSVTFQMTFSPQSPGAANAKASFTVASPTSTLQAALTGTGTSTASHSVTISWNADTSKVTGYNVYRSGHSGGPFVRQTSSLDTNTDYTDSTVTSGDTYYYQVTAVNKQGLESSPSKVVSATVP
jgi:hypothetical protein